MDQAFDAQWTVVMWIFLCVVFAASIACYARKVAPPLWVTLAVALALRLVVVAISHTHTPDDVNVFFRYVGNLALQGRDPLTFASLHVELLTGDGLRLRARAEDRARMVARQ